MRWPPRWHSATWSESVKSWGATGMGMIHKAARTTIRLASTRRRATHALTRRNAISTPVAARNDMEGSWQQQPGEVEGCIPKGRASRPSISALSPQKYCLVQSDVCAFKIYSPGPRSPPLPSWQLSFRSRFDLKLSKRSPPPLAWGSRRGGQAGSRSPDHATSPKARMQENYNVARDWRECAPSMGDLMEGSRHRQLWGVPKSVGQSGSELLFLD